MQAIVKPSVIYGTVTAPASKSSMQRACAAALVRKGISIIHNPGKSNDDKAAQNVISQMGCVLKMEEGDLVIDSTRAFNEANTSPILVNCGESGLGIRMFAPLVALCNSEVIINGEGSLLTRPMNFFDEIFPSLGIKIISNNGKLPLQIKGPLIAKDIEIDGSLSSQFLTGLLMVYAALDAKDVAIKVNNLKSKPYIDLTLKVMKDFGLKTPVNDNYEAFYFDSANKENHSITNYTVEGDWSGAAFLLVAGAVAGNISVKGLDINSTQADKKILEALKSCGSSISFSENNIEVASAPLTAFHFDATDCPDLFPPLAALATNCKGVTSIEGVHRLAHKESDRALTIKEELGKMNVEVELKENTMRIHGKENIKGTIVHSHHDHRIAMMCAVAGLRADAETTIEDADAINKSYPDFFEHLKIIHANVLTYNS